MTGDAQHIEQVAANAWPAAIVQVVDGWLLRATPGVTRRRSNSALPAPSTGEDAEGEDWTLARLRVAEDFARRHGLRPAVQVSPADAQSGLDALLERRGYVRDGPVEVLRASLDAVRDLTGPPVSTVVAKRRDRVWDEAFIRLLGRDDALATLTEVIDRIGPRAGFARAELGGHTAAVALAVVERGWAGVFCMETDPAHRRRGLAAAMLRGLAVWAGEHGATGLYLQVTEDNDPARALYARAGFTLSHRYHYRTARAP